LNEYVVDLKIIAHTQCSYNYYYTTVFKIRILTLNKQIFIISMST